ncbi:MAG: transposase [Pyrinomonadaceae bacterium]
MDDVARKPTYRQEWSAYNLAQTNEKARFQELLYELCQSIDDLPRKPGAGRNRLPLGEMIFCAAYKVFSTVSGRRFISDLREAQKRGLISKTPHFNSIFNYLEMEEMTAFLKQLIITSSLPLKSVESDFAVDSSGFSTGRFVRWLHAKYSKPQVIDKADWLKVHLMCGVKTNIVTSVEVTGRYEHDHAFFKPLVETTAQNFKMQEVSADKAYLSAANLRLVTDKQAMPYIPFKANSTVDRKRKQDTMWKWMFHYYMANQEKFMQSYHKRSNVESTFAMIKAKFGERLRSKTEVAQVNEVLCKVLCHNLCCVIQSMYELGVDVNFCAESPLAQKLEPFT